MDLAGGGSGAQAGACEDARILSTAKVEGDSAVWATNTTFRLQDFGYKTQDSTTQDIGDRSKFRIQEYIQPPQPAGLLGWGQRMTGSALRAVNVLCRKKFH